MLLKRVSLALAVAAAFFIALAPETLAAHAVYRSGSGSIAPTYGADLDNGVFNGGIVSGPTNDDVFYDSVSATKRYFMYNESANNKLLRMSSKPSYAGCASAALGHNRYNISKNVGRWFCVRTTEGRLARVQIVSAPASSPVQIKYTVWK